MAAETSCRSATAEELYKKQVLELRPSRKRRRQIVSDDPDDDVYVPFTDDLHGALQEEGQSPFVDVSREPDQPQPGGVPANPPESEADSLAEEFRRPIEQPSLEAPPGLDQDIMASDDDMVPTTPLTSSLQSGQPEREVSPGLLDFPEAEGPSANQPLEDALQETSEQAQLPDQQETGEQQVTQLTQALRSSPARLDGISPNQNSRANFVEKIPKSLAFISSRQTKQVKKYKKKAVKAGAGREINYDKSTPEVREKLDASRTKEWNQWKKFTDGVWVTEEELRKLQKEHPSLQVVPTRWVDVNKAEVNEPDILKSRLVVRGDLEDSSQMRTDSPTCSQTMISMVAILSACRDTTLWAGDISAAFLQGSKMGRILALKMPKGGIPGEPDGRYYVVTSTVYGTKDAPRGWFKNLHQSLVHEGFQAVPHEVAAYKLLEEDGSLAGLVISHVDDLMWTGGKTIEGKMKNICERYQFGKIESDRFRYCGRDIVKDEKKISITCSSLIDRVRPIFLNAEQRKNRTQRVSDHIKGQLRSVIGSLAWLGRVCRPDLSHAISRLQSCVHQATYEDVIFANQIINLARRTKDEGISYPIGAFKFEEAMIVAIQDASHAADFDVSGSGKKLGFRS